MTGPEPAVLPACVVGAAPAGGELDAFWDYLDTIRAVPPRLVTLTNDWYQLGWRERMSEATVGAELAAFAAMDPTLDVHCLDDGWDGSWEPATGLWGRLDPGRFPGGLAALASAAGPNAGIGLWIGPFGGYPPRLGRRVAWGENHGMEVDPGIEEDGTPDVWGRRLCPAGDRYGAHLGEALEAWTAAGVRYWKLDGVQFDCPAPDHGHAVGPGGRTSQMDRFAATMDRARAADPGVVVAFTSGSNPSPWWLAHADFLWRGGLDDSTAAAEGVPAHERFATYIDECLDEYRDTALPMSALVPFAVVENEAAGYRTPGDAEGWARHCWWMVGRGTLHHDLYVAPDSLSSDEWATVARALAWARDHQHVLARSRMVGGHPADGDVYGFASRHQGRAVLALRNPAPVGRDVTVAHADLACAAGSTVSLISVWSDASPSLPGVLAPGDEVAVTVAPFGVLLLSSSGDGSPDLGARSVGTT